MDFKGFFTKSEIENLPIIKDGECFGLKEDAVLKDVEFKKGDIAMYSKNKWINMCGGVSNDCCKLTKDIDAKCTVGFIEEGDTLEKGTTFTEVFDNMFRRKNA